MNRFADTVDVVGRDVEYILGSLAEELAQMSGRHLLVTGGGGFLGYYLVQVPLVWNRTVPPEQRIRLTVYDNYARGVPRWLTRLASDPCLAIERHDVTTPLPPSAGEADYIVHAASIASPTFYRRLPLETMDANVNGLRNLLGHCRDRESSRCIEALLFFSSSEIYGDPPPDQIPTPETYRGFVSCTGPRACYDESKRFGETLCWTFARSFGLPVKTVRPFNNFGPGLRISDRRVIPDFAGNVLNGEDIVLFSDGSARRTFCYIADAIVGYFKVLVRGAAGEAYNIGADQPEITMDELARLVSALGRELFGYSGAVIHRASPDTNYLVDNPTRRCPSIEKARRELAFEPRIPLEDGLKRSLLWYASNEDAQ